GSATVVMTVRPPRPGLTLIRPADDQLARRRRTLEGLQSQSRASAAALVSTFPLPTIHARASLSERVRIGTMFASAVAVAPGLKVVPESLAPSYGSNSYFGEERNIEGDVTD